MIDPYWFAVLGFIFCSIIGLLVGIRIGSSPSDDHVVGNLILHDTPEGKEMYIQLSSEDFEVLSKQKRVSLKVVNIDSQE